MTKKELDTIVKEYSSMTDIEHVLNRPDSYIGNINTLPIETDVIIDEKIVSKKLNKNAGFYKIFDEVITNCIDESKENKNLDKIDVIVTDDHIEVIDNGGIPVVKSEEFDNKYLPEFLFGQLRTSSNYNDEKKRDVAGTNGIGAKATCIFSKRFIVETADGKNKFQQEFKENLSKRTRAKIEESSKNYTKIKYYPDLEKFGMEKIDDTHINLFRKRVFDLAGLNKHIKFSFNKEKISFKSFKDYCSLYNIDEENFLFSSSDTWDIGITYSENGFKQVSFVNGIQTSSGGTHVEYIFNQIVDFLRPYFLKKYKLDIKPYEIRNNLFLFVNSTIINNKFASQTKELLTTDQKNFGTEFIIPNTLLNKLIKTEVVQRILDWKQTKLEIAERVELRKLNKKVEKLKVPNLIDCSSKNREECNIGIYEGFSAANGGVKNRDPKTQALYLLKGKILNTHGLKDAKILQDKELSGLISALGLTLGDPSIENLRYGKILIVTDMDVDGANICSLLINFLASNWIELFKQEKVYRVLTPLMIVREGKKQIDIYSDQEYKNYIKNNKDSNFRVEYKKGLGALSDTDYKKMMKEPKLLKLTIDDSYKESLNNWFGKDSDIRKELLT